VLEKNDTIKDWRVWLFDLVSKNADLFNQIFRATTINELFDGSFAAKTDSKDRAKTALPTLQNLTRLWMRAEPPSVLQLAMGPTQRSSKHALVLDVLLCVSCQNWHTFSDFHPFCCNGKPVKRAGNRQSCLLR
jgi:hypothetical protein